MKRVMVVDSDLERETLSILQAFQWRMARRHQAVVTIEKPTDRSVRPRPGMEHRFRP
jgi:hypothetical protein